MKTLTFNEMRNNIQKIIEMVKKGEEIIIKNEQNQEKVAVIISYKKFKLKRERPLGILKGKANYKIKDNFQITDEELQSI